jgi:antitoxin component HigA of HigAB toxin-antitoxin module
MTPDQLRDRVRNVLAAAPRVSGPEITCAACKGTGRVRRSRRAVTHADVAAAIGVGRTTIPNFLSGRQGLTMEKTLALIDWLDDQ